jgi:hypothetical protein
MPQLLGRFVLTSEDGATAQGAAARAGLPLLSKPFTASQLDAMLGAISDAGTHKKTPPVA